VTASLLTIETPEHVPIALEPAGAGSRFLAVLVDAAITMGLSLAIVWGTAKLLPRGVVEALFVTTSFVLTWGWHLWFETRGRGQTPGKRMLSLRVIDARGLPVSLHQSLARNIVRTVDFLPAFYGIGAVISLLDGRRRRLGDIVASTLVIREAQPLAGSALPAGQRRHNTLRTPRALRAIRHRVSLDEREFLLRLCLRAPKLSPAARYDLMEDVARYYRGRLEVEEEQMSGENFVRDLTAVLYDR
jgi:uncharacterized RDD family membrane protein YckC